MRTHTSLLMLLGFLLLRSSVCSAVIYVDCNAPGPTHDGTTWDTAFLTIQEGVTAAPVNGSVWVANGVYTENVTISASGVKLYGGFLGAEQVGYETDLSRRDYVANDTTINGGQNGSCVSITHNHIVVDGFTLTNGSGTYYYSSLCGGAVYCYYVINCTIRNNTITGNTAARGGAIYCCGGSSTTSLPNIIKDNTITYNTAANGYGGAVYCTNVGPNTIANNTMTDNSAAGGYGGAVYCNDTLLTITYNKIVNNSAAYGGAVYCATSSNSTIASNMIINNRAADGGAVYCAFTATPSAVVTNNTITGNSATDGHGGAIYCAISSSPTISNNIIVSNTATYGGGIWCGAPSSPVLKNNNFWDNDPEDCVGCTIGDAPVTDDPCFIDPKNGDYHLAKKSPCIDAGNNAAPGPGLGQLGTTDFEGNKRDIDGFGDYVPSEPTVDIGADEFAVCHLFWYDVQPKNWDYNYNVKGAPAEVLETLDGVFVDGTWGDVTYNWLLEVCDWAEAHGLAVQIKVYNMAENPKAYYDRTVELCPENPPQDHYLYTYPGKEPIQGNYPSGYLWPAVIDNDYTPDDWNNKMVIVRPGPDPSADIVCLWQQKAKENWKQYLKMIYSFWNHPAVQRPGGGFQVSYGMWGELSNGDDGSTYGYQPQWVAWEYTDEKLIGYCKEMIDYALSCGIPPERLESNHGTVYMPLSYAYPGWRDDVRKSVSDYALQDHDPIRKGVQGLALGSNGLSSEMDSSYMWQRPETYGTHAYYAHTAKRYAFEYGWPNEMDSPTELQDAFAVAMKYRTEKVRVKVTKTVWSGASIKSNGCLGYLRALKGLPPYEVLQTTAPSGFFNPGWVWFSLPLVPPTMPVGQSQPNTLLGCSCNNRLYSWNAENKTILTYPNRDVFYSIGMGKMYKLHLNAEENCAPSYEGLQMAMPYYRVLRYAGTAWVGAPGPQDILGSALSVWKNGVVRTPAQDRAAADPWINWNWAYWDSDYETVRTMNPFGGGDDDTIHPWYGYQVYAHTDNVTIIFP